MGGHADGRLDMILGRVNGSAARIGNTHGPKILSGAGTLVLLPERLVEAILTVVGAIPPRSPVVDVHVDLIGRILGPVAGDTSSAERIAQDLAVEPVRPPKIV